MLDKLLVDAAAEAGAEVREGFNVEEVVIEDGTRRRHPRSCRGGASVTERARIVIGADGINSTVAKAVRPEQYAEKPKLLCGLLRLLERVADERHVRDLHPAQPGLRGDPHQRRSDPGDRRLAVRGVRRQQGRPAGQLPRDLRLGAGTRRSARGATQESRLFGSAVPNFFRKPYGPGWALVGDAGYNRDFITAQGISDAFRDAELCATAVDDWLSGERAPDEALGGYQQTRDATVMPMYELTAQAASLEPPPPEMQELLGAIAGNQAAMDGFVQVNSGALPPADFFSPDNIGQIFAAAHTRA